MLFTEDILSTAVQIFLLSKGWTICVASTEFRTVHMLKPSGFPDVLDFSDLIDPVYQTQESAYLLDEFYDKHFVILDGTLLPGSEIRISKAALESWHSLISQSS